MECFGELGESILVKYISGFEWNSDSDKQTF